VIDEVLAEFDENTNVQKNTEIEKTTNDNGNDAHHKDAEAAETPVVKAFRTSNRRVPLQRSSGGQGKSFRNSTCHVSFNVTTRESRGKSTISKFNRKMSHSFLANTSRRSGIAL